MSSDKQNPNCGSVLMDLPILPASSSPVRATLPPAVKVHSSSDKLRLPLNASYSGLLLLSAGYLAISGYASFWRSSLYIGAGVGCFTVLYAITLLIACRRPAHPLSGPPSSSYAARVYAVLISVCWALVTGFVVAASVKSKRIYNERNENWRRWVYAEVGLEVGVFLVSVAVSTLQFLQHRRHILDVEAMKELPPSDPDYLRMA